MCTCTLYVFIYYPLNIVQAHLHSNHNLAVTFTLTPVLQIVEKEQIFQEIEGCLNQICLLQNSLLVKPISFKCNFVCFGIFFMRGRK